MNALALLCEIIAQDNQTAAAAYRKLPDYSALLGCGLMVEGGTVSSASCLDCGQPHDAEVVHDGASYGYHCPDLGFMPLDRAEVAALAANVDCLVGRLADLYKCKRRKSAPVHGVTWRVGAIESEDGDIAIYFHPRLLDAGDAQHVADTLAREVSARYRLILTAQGTLPVPSAHVVALPEVVALKSETGTLEALTDVSDIVGAPVTRRGGAPNRYGSILADLIETRIKLGDALDAVKTEARAIEEAFRAAHPTLQAPSPSTIRRYVREARRGS